MEVFRVYMDAESQNNEKLCISTVFRYALTIENIT